MLFVKVRIYRAHDYDLMVLAQLGLISIASIAKKAVEACFLGEDYKVDIKLDKTYVPPELTSKLSTRVRLSNDDVPGIEEWFREFSEGARNNMVKCLIRRAIGDVPIWAYRRDGWTSAADAKEEEAEVEKMLAEAK